MEKADVYILKVNGKRIFATSLFVECHIKQNELTVKGIDYQSEHLKLTEKEHREILKECCNNICGSYNMDLKHE